MHRPLRRSLMTWQTSCAPLQKAEDYRKFRRTVNCMLGRRMSMSVVEVAPFPSAISGGSAPRTLPALWKAIGQPEGACTSDMICNLFHRALLGLCGRGVAPTPTAPEQPDTPGYRQDAPSGRRWSRSCRRKELVTVQSILDMVVILGGV